MKVRILLFAIIAMLLFTGCNKEEPQKEEPVVTDGFYKQGTLHQAGVSVADVEKYNLKDISFSSHMEEGNAETVVRLSFVSGSRLSGDGEEHENSGVPAHNIYALDNPARLVVELDGVSYWDYRRNMELFGGVQGVFSHIPAQNPRISLYFQLESPVRFLASIDGDDIVVRLRKEQAEDAEKYFVTVNAYDAYRSGVIPAESDLTPTLSGNLENVLMISPPFSTEEEAVQYESAAKTANPLVDPDLFRVVALQSGKLPAYDRSLDYLTIERQSVIRLESGATVSVPVLAPDGLYLADLPDGSGYLYSRLETTDDGASYQRLYISLYTGVTRPATSFEFIDIDRACFSPDGRKLVVLERTSDSTHLYVFDSNTYELLNDLSEMGFGGNTGAFLFNSLGNSIYAVTGVSDVQLHQFDYSIPNEQERHSIVDQNSVDEGSLGYSDGELYFAHSTMEQGSMIYRIKPEGGVRKPFMPGGTFSISNDEKYMAVSSSGETSTTGTSSNTFELYDFATGTRTSISDSVYPYDFIWSKDCSKLFYIESRLSGGQTEGDTSDDAAQDEAQDESGDTPDEPENAPADDVPLDAYPYTLWIYDIASGVSERLFDMMGPDIHPSDDNGMLYLCITQAQEEEESLRATYILNLQDIFQKSTPIEGDGMETVEE
ncbi:hypothetical protein LJC27_07355 [Christensenellaceae bacterium OttesenSCG-928-M15]|nr:hypothetical protein [Christensenellaceae bacterium OttesenSCG-928-M15]